MSISFVGAKNVSQYLREEHSTKIKKKLDYSQRGKERKRQPLRLYFFRNLKICNYSILEKRHRRILGVQFTWGGYGEGLKGIKR